jgi:hypothetical protein
MARLSIEQIKAPDLSVASEATKRAGDSFQEGMASASALLGSYQTGLEAQGDSELTNLLAGAKNEDEWNAIVANTDFSKMNISDTMRMGIIDRRDNILGYEKARADTGFVGAQTRNTDATAARTRNQTGIDTNQDNREGELHGFRIKDEEWTDGKRSESAANAGQALAAAEESMSIGNQTGQPTYGSQAVSNILRGDGPGTNLGPRADGSGLRTADGSGGTDQQIKYRNGIAGIESAGSGDYAAVGATNEKLGRALGRYQIMEANIPQWSKEALGREVSVEEFMADSSIQDAIFDNKFGGYVEKYGEEGAAQAWFGGDGGVGQLDRTDVHGRKTIGSYGQTFMGSIGSPSNATTQPNSRDRAVENPNQLAGPENQKYLDMLKNSKFQSTEEVLTAYQNMYDYSATGQNAIDLEDQKIAEEAIAQTLLDSASGTADPTTALLDALKNNPGSTAVEKAANAARIHAAQGDGGVFSAAILGLGTTGAPPADIATANTTLVDMKERQDRDPFQFAMNAAGSFENDPVGMLETAMKGLDISIVPSELEGAINKLASDAQISRAEAAYSFARAAEDNRGLNAAGWFTPGGDNLSQNKAETFANKHFASDQSAKARASLNQDRMIAEEIQVATTNLGKIERDIQKAVLNDGTVSKAMRDRRDEARAIVNKFYADYGNRGENFGGGRRPPPNDPGEALSQSVYSGGRGRNG